MRGFVTYRFPSISLGVIHTDHIENPGCGDLAYTVLHAKCIIEHFTVANNISEEY